MDIMGASMEETTNINFSGETSWENDEWKG
jgi:hypothetical protein